MIAIQVSDSLSGKLPAALEDFSFLQPAALQALRLSASPAATGETGLSIVISDDAQLQELNRQFLSLDAPTDVLSFPADEVDPESGERYLGDVIISLPQAAAQAKAGGHSVQDELRLLVVHGVLHLLGYDHAEADEKDRMWTIQAQVLQQLGLSLNG
jgi:probable rRNA maturation factor